MKMNKGFVGLSICVLLTLVTLKAFANPTVGEFVDDSVITTKIKEEILLDKSLSSLNFNIETKKGVVSISGKVPTDHEASKAVEIASSTEGVVDVNTAHLKIEKSTSTSADLYITAKIKGSYVKEKIFGDKDVAVTNVHVETKNGVVYLTGHVDTADQKSNAEKLAKSIKGVKEVDSKGLNLK
ncbi:MAG TPA: BON domain-containing protein [Gammaproteobacteria bacterium]|nr:BON domain-containing protein [Gammaproteobacteria bacterium]